MARAIPSRNTLKKYNIFAAIKFIKNIVTNLDSSKSSATDCISVMVLENCKSWLSYMLPELLKICQKESCFSDY